MYNKSAVPIHVGSIAFRRCEKNASGATQTVPTEMGIVTDKYDKPIGVSFRLQECLNFLVVNPDIQFAGIRCVCYTKEDLASLKWIGMRVISVHPHGTSATCEPILGDPETDLFPHYEMTFALEESTRALKFLVEHRPEVIERLSAK